MSEIKKYDRIYTIGCFDWFHYGHIRLLNRLKDNCNTLIVGVHDDDSIEKLKNLEPKDHQQIKERMANVKKYADIVYIIPDTDPTFFLNCIIRDDDNKETACYMRANDMLHFPGRDLVEKKISLEFVEYTEGISSTDIRSKKK